MVKSNRTRDNLFVLRATDQEVHRIKRRMAQAHQKTFQGFALEMLLQGQVATYDYSELQALRLEVNRIGQNINQLVRYVNTFEDLDSELMEALLNDIKTLKDVIGKEFKVKELAKAHGHHQSSSDQRKS
ncbi:plasmid mobilization protein [Streptococcus hyointestinalis]|uniref:Mobilization protein n=1 Tax=Streptococcus hyointestinalis TaxID=1337 RepID=A0A380KFF9_9STRE|nr:plasmid mobilization relaxosome protein MobC [Streptococcus hyointestinalis]SUN63017.1 mobilization protein [Streptococcus hyointestinalis]